MNVIHDCVSVAPLGVGLRVIPLQGNRVREILDRRLRRVALEEGEPATVVRLGEFFIASYRFGELIQGLVELALVQVSETALIVWLRSFAV